MSKKSTGIIIAILTVLTILFGTYTGIHYFFNYKTSEWFTQNINDNNYTIIAKEVGAPFLDGNSNVLITIKDNKKGKFLALFSCEIKNNGKVLSEHNYYIEDNADYVKISFFDIEENLISAYRFYYSDFDT